LTPGVDRSTGSPTIQESGVKSVPEKGV
jgi:hypothetical protein